MTETSSDTTSPRIASWSAVMAIPLFFVRGVTRILEAVPKLIEKLAFLE